MNEYTLYEAFDKDHYIHLEYIPKVHNYIAGNLISWSPNRCFGKQNTTMQQNYTMFAIGKRSVACHQWQKKERQFVTMNL